MIVQILDHQDRIAYMSGLHPWDVENGLTVEDVIGQDVWEWIAAGADRYRQAFAQCRETGQRQICDISVAVAGQIHRWIAKVDRFGPDHLIIIASNIPVNIDALSEREQQVLQLLAQHTPSSQIAERLGITVSTVEKHRSKIRNTLNLENEQSLRRLADAITGLENFFFATTDQQQAS